MGRVTCDPLPGRRKDGPFLGDAFGRLQATAAARARCFKIWFDVLTSIGVVVGLGCLFWCLALGGPMVCVGWVLVWSWFSFPLYMPSSCFPCSTMDRIAAEFFGQNCCRIFG